MVSGPSAFTTSRARLGLFKISISELSCSSRLMLMTGLLLLLGTVGTYRFSRPIFTRIWEVVS